MSIREIAALYHPEPQPSVERRGGGRPGGQAAGSFADALSASLSAPSPVAGQSGAVADVAEMMRLDMMRSAISLENPPQSPVSAQGPAGAALMLQALPRMDQRFDTGLDASPAPQAVGASEAPKSAPAPAGMDEIMQRASRRYGVDAGLIKAVIKAESNFNPRAVSSAGAQGLMQLMPSTARGLGVTDSFDPEQNIMAGTRFLRDLLARYGGDVDSALAAYNWGPGNVDRHPARLPRETREYLARVRRYYDEFVG